MAKSDVLCYKFIQDRIKGYIRYKTKITCPKCKKTRWVLRTNILKATHFTSLCQSCNGRSGSENGMWKGGIIKANASKENYYLLQHVDKNSPFRCMSDSRGYILEHRYIIAKKLGRPLKKQEVVHHINGIKNDNREENLELLNSKQKHYLITRMEIRIKQLEKQVIDLEKKL